MKRLLTIIALLLTLLIVGTIGFRLVTGASWIECLYESVIFLTTVGSHEPSPLTSAGMIFIIGYLLCGLGVFTYSAFQLGYWVVNSQLHAIMEKRRMEKRIEKLENHFVICGMGRMGEVICEYFARRRKPFVVIDVDENRLVPQCLENGWLHIHGDATDDDVLLRAGIKNARALASVLPTDADNVYVVLASRMLNPGLQIIARASDENAVSKMQRAGANRVISSITSGAVKIARFLLYPGIEDFLEITDARDSDLEVADVLIAKNSPYVGKKLSETDLRQRGIMVIGIRRTDGERLMPPPGTATIQAGDCLFAFGSAHAINEINEASLSDS